MVFVGIIFEVNVAKTVPGEGMFIAGDAPELGSWQPAFGIASADLQLRTSALMYPRWSMVRPIWFELAANGRDHRLRIEYKYLIDRSTAIAQWEDHISNRCVELQAEDGAIWLLSDACWGTAQRPAQLRRITEGEVCARWSSFDPSWVASTPPARMGGKVSLPLLEKGPGPRGRAAPGKVGGYQWDDVSLGSCTAIAALQAANAKLRRRLRKLGVSSESETEEESEATRSPARSASVASPDKLAQSFCGDSDLGSEELDGVLARRWRRVEQNKYDKQDIVPLTADGSRSVRRCWLDDTPSPSAKGVPEPQEEPQVGERVLGF